MIWKQRKVCHSKLDDMFGSGTFAFIGMLCSCSLSLAFHVADVRLDFTVYGVKLNQIWEKYEGLPKTLRAVIKQLEQKGKLRSCVHLENVSQ